MAGLIATASACGLPEDSAPGGVGIPEGALSPPTTAPVVTGPETNAEERFIYLLRDDQLRRVARLIERPVTLNKVFDQLELGPNEDEVEEGVRSAFPAGTEILGVFLLGNGTLEVNLNEAFTAFEGDVQTQALAQIVFTGTELGNVTNGVLFRIENESTAFPREDGSLAIDESGVPVPLTRDDYRELDPVASLP
jgi:spore germination protein GerM